ncbi:hypothetical protein VNO77_05426 [Canavalia gladiata]|uniref:Uncharacterized protein n=1 Tax=Canavalia gladiata TaxID=3824 RepID=A0AAN9R5N6_CANGL
MGINIILKLPHCFILYFVCFVFSCCYISLCKCNFKTHTWPKAHSLLHKRKPNVSIPSISHWKVSTSLGRVVLALRSCHTFTLLWVLLLSFPY